MVSRIRGGERAWRIEIRPNQSLTPRQSQLFFAFMSVVVLTVAGSFTIIGFWPILPFAGLELAVLATGLWLCAKAGTETEVVRVEADHVAVDKGRGHLECVWEANTAWAQIALLPSRLAWYPSRLVMRSHGREVRLGAFLNEEERRLLAAHLHEAIGSTKLPGDARR